jgi:hypothetical protein
MMTDEPFGRQPKPVTVTVHSESDQDKYAAAIKLRRFLEGQFDLVVMRRDRESDKYLILCFPRAVND